MEITITCYISAILGWLLYIVAGMQKAQKSHKADFKYIIWLQDNLLALIISGISVILLMILLPDLVRLDLIPEKIKPVVMIISAIIGWFNFSLLKKVLDIGSPKKLRKL